MTSVSTISRPYQVTVWGATGFVGNLVCERLAREYPNQLRIAIAGRSRNKLEALRDEMTRFDPSFKDVGIVVANADDSVAIDSFTKSTDVVISCAGPYRKYSSNVVASSAANGTHYLDLTAEIPWVRSNIRQFHDLALKNKSKIIHFCGYESAPTDLGTLYLVNEIRKKYNTGCGLVEQYLVGSMGSVSGGTMASGIDIYASASPFELEAMQDPYCLTPDHLNSLSGAEYEGMTYNEDLKAWNVPSIFSRFTIPTVYRSNALAREPYGKNFKCRDGIKTPNLPLALAAQSLVYLLSLPFQTSFSRRTQLEFIQFVAPNPGSGPGVDLQRKIGFWKALFVGYPEGIEGAEPVFLRFEDNQGDPGYWSTSKMLLECALSLVLDGSKVNEAASLQGGVLTPASALGLVPLERLKTAGYLISGA